MLSPLEIILKKEGKEKIAIISIDQDRMCIYGKDEDLDLDEMHFLTSIAFIYIGSHQKEAILTPQDIVSKGTSLYTHFYDKYTGIKNIGEMTLDEFNKFIKKYNGRKK